jgi:hypothetical protein
MNERIKQLAEQAKDWAYAEHDGYTAQMLFEQKFAELIVRECANTIQTEKDTGLYTAQQMTGMTVSKAVINNHFEIK